MVPGYWIPFDPRTLAIDPGPSGSIIRSFQAFGSIRPPVNSGLAVTQTCEDLCYLQHRRRCQPVTGTMMTDHVDTEMHHQSLRQTLCSASYGQATLPTYGDKHGIEPHLRGQFQCTPFRDLKRGIQDIFTSMSHLIPSFTRLS